MEQTMIDTLYAREMDGRRVKLTNLAPYGRAYVGDNGYVYMDDERENPHPLYEDDRFPTWLWELVDRYRGIEINLYTILLLRLKIDPETQQVEVDRDGALYFYEYGFDGNVEGDTDDLGEMMETVFEVIIPSGSTVYIDGHERTYTAGSWRGTHYQLYGTRLESVEGQLLTWQDIDWERTLAGIGDGG